MKALAKLLERVRTWPEGAQEEATRALREIEEDFVVGPATQAELDLSHEQAMRGEGIPMEEVFARHNL